MHRKRFIGDPAGNKVSFGDPTGNKGVSELFTVGPNATAIIESTSLDKTEMTVRFKLNSK